MAFFIDLSILCHNRNFRLLYLGQFISFIGTVITNVALPYQIYQETHSTLIIGLLSLCQLLPLLITALVGGALADRRHRKQLLLISEGLMALGCLILAFNSTLLSPKIWLIFITSTCMSAINGLHRPALDSMIQQLVSKDELASVSSLASFKFSISMIVGPAIGGLIIARFGIVITYLIDFLSFAISLIALLNISKIPKPKANKDPSTWAALKSGFQYALSRQELVGTYLVDFIAMVFGMPTALFPAIAHYYGGVKTLGLLYSAPAVGALFISFFSGWTKTVKRHGLAIAIAAILWGSAIIGFGMANHLWLALFFLCLSGAFDAISGIFRMTMWNETIPNEYRGRLAGIEMISYLSGPKLGDTEAGLVAAVFGVSVSIISGGILCILGVMACCYFLPKFNYYQSND